MPYGYGRFARDVSVGRYNRPNGVLESNGPLASGLQKKARSPRWLRYLRVNTWVPSQPLSNHLRRNSEPCASIPQAVVVVWTFQLRILRLCWQKNGTSPKDPPETAEETGNSLLTS